METEAKAPVSKRHFILQQGLDAPAGKALRLQYYALMFQPRVVTSVVLLGVIFQSPAIFLVLSGILWWSALLPRRNLFDAVYNKTLGSRPGSVRLSPAPPPRRFAQGMAGSFALAIGVLLIFGMAAAAIVLQVVLLAALAALIFGRFCLGSFTYHLLTGRSEFAVCTLPWKPSSFSKPPST